MLEKCICRGYGAEPPVANEIIKNIVEKSLITCKHLKISIESLPIAKFLELVLTVPVKFQRTITRLGEIMPHRIKCQTEQIPD